ncbi:MAG: alpha/beta hydrolase [Thermoplasmata archaeon]|nr:MAG: alpha/beta hydrolase [Thermoplasmata archaeon]
MLIFIHGLWATGDVWRPFIQYFKDRNFDCNAINLRDGLDIRKTCFRDYVNKVKAVATKNDILIGHSMGGLIVQKVAEEMVIKGGVAICSAPPKGIKFRKSMIFSSAKYLPKVIMKKPFKPSFPFVKKFFLNCVGEKAWDIYNTLEPESATIAYELIMSKIEVDERKVRCPLLFIATRDDIASHPEMVKQMAKKYNAECVVEEGCHWIFDRWRSIAERIQEFIIEIYKKYEI